MTKIISKIHQRGDRCESSWPSDYGTLERGIFHIDEETGECKRGYPESKIQKLGEAPYIITDEMKPYYHPGICRTVDTRSGLRAADAAAGTITTDKFIEGNRNHSKELERKRREDIKHAIRTAVGQIDNGNPVLPAEIRAQCERKDEVIAAALPHLDPHNAVGRISNAKGKRYKRKHSI